MKRSRIMKCLWYAFLVIAAVSTLRAERVVTIDCSSPLPPPEAEPNMGGKAADGTFYGVNRRFFTQNGRPWFPVMGEMHYVRVPASEWERGLAKMKATGCDVVSTYALWVNHERTEGQWRWTGQEDLRRFLMLAQRQGLKVWLRIGPYCNAEARNGGFPDYVARMPNKRSNRNPAYLAAVQRWYAQVAEQTKGLFVKDGGPIVGIQLENEYASGQPEHIEWLRKTAEALGMSAPYITVTANTRCDFASGRYLPLQGAYPFRFWGNLNEPTQDFLYKSETWGAMFNEYKDYYDPARFMVGFCEMGAGMDSSDGQRVIVPVRNAEALAQDTLGRGGNQFGWYMYHGGTQERGMERQGHRLTYYDNAPIGEFGQINACVKGLRLVQSFVRDFTPEFVPTIRKEPQQRPTGPRDTKTPRVVARDGGGSGFVLMSTFQGNVAMEDQREIRFRLALPGGKTLTFPSRPFTLKKDISICFPYGQTFGGVPLTYASAVPFARLSEGSHTVLFFYAAEGIPPEFAFPEGVKLSGPGLRGKAEGVSTMVSTPGLRSAFTVTAPNGASATYVTLTRAQAEQAWRIRLAGKDRLLLSAADLWSTDGHTLTLAARDPESLTVQTVVLEHGQPTFAILHPVERPVPLAITPMWKEHSPSSYSLTWTGGLPKGVNDLWIDMRYIGNTAAFYVDGTLHTDHRNNGEPWRVGLRRFLGDGKPHTFRVDLEPYNPNVRGLPAHVIPQTPEEAKGCFRERVLVPEYTAQIEFSQR